MDACLELDWRVWARDGLWVVGVYLTGAVEELAAAHLKLIVIRSRKKKLFASITTALLRGWL